MKTTKKNSRFQVLFVSVTLLILSGIGGFVYLTQSKIGDLRPALLPARQTFAELLQGKADPTVAVPQGTTTEELGKSNITIPSGFTIRVVTDQLQSPRDLLVTPDKTLLASDNKSGEVFAVIDSDGDGQRDNVKSLVKGLNVAHGLAFHNGKLFIAEETKVSKYEWNPDTLELSNPQTVLALPTGGRHTSRTMVIQEDGQLFISLGSRCDTCFEDHPWIGSVIVTNTNGENPRVYSSGLRNAVFLALHPQTQKVWATEMGRDRLGDDLPPDEINILSDGADYGWPICYGDKVYDSVFGQRNPEDCAQTTSPVFNIQAHSAPLGLTFIQSSQFPDEWQNDLLVAYHGSWNRTVPVGYKIVRLEIGDDLQSVVAEHDFLSGFLQGSEALGRPVDVEFDQDGNLFISDDKTGAIYQVSRAEQ